MTHDDYDILYAVLSDSDIMRHYPYTFDEKRVRGWIDRNRQRYSDFGFGLWAVCLAENGVMIGDCGLAMQNINGTILPEIGYHIAKIHQNKGYATEAARAVRDWTFAVTPFRSLYSYVKKENLRVCGGRTRKRYDPDRRIYRRQGRTVACISNNPHGMVEK